MLSCRLEYVRRVRHAGAGEQVAVQDQRLRLEEALQAHYTSLELFCPQLGLAMDLTPEDPDKDPIYVPSSFTEAQREQFGMTALGRAEYQIRLAHGHDSLAELRRSLSLRCFLVRKGRQSNGHVMMKRSQDAIARADSEIQVHYSAYRRTWGALMALPGIKDPALRELRKEDLAMLSRWMDDERYRGVTRVLRREQREAQELPWIWKMAPAEPGDDEEGDDEDSVKARVDAWGMEGVCPDLRSKIRVLNDRPSPSLSPPIKHASRSIGMGPCCRGADSMAGGGRDPPARNGPSHGPLHSGRVGLAIAISQPT